MLKVNPKDICVVPEGHLFFPDGAIVRVVDIDPIHGDYLVSTLQDEGKFGNDFDRYMQTTHWVKGDNIFPIKLKKRPISGFIRRIYVKVSLMLKRFNPWQKRK